jgi:hypothetical protein
LAQEIPQNQSQSLSENPNLNIRREQQGNLKGEGGAAAVPASLGGRSTMESMPVHKPSQGFREGGEMGITMIVEGDEGGGG